MTSERDIRLLVQELIDSDTTPDEVCRDHPELLNDVRLRWQRVRAVEGQIDALFPSSDQRMIGAKAAPLDFAEVRIPGYEIHGVLGHGGMGVVYRALHLSLNRFVAIKMQLAGAFASPSERQRLLREARAVAALGHPNIVTVHDVGEVDARPYFTMELIDAPHLGARLANTPQPAREAAAMVATLADAVQCAHQAGIVHCDLKPANVLLTSDGTPKITDFGLARKLDSDATLTLPGFPFGTPSYMAPEQAGGRPGLSNAPAVDVYALGAILYEMLTGRPPFRAETAIETQRQVIEEEPAPPSRVNAKVPPDLETICLKCLEKDAARRYATAAELGEDLRRFERGEPIMARRAGPMDRIAKWVRRRPSQAALLTVGVIVVAAAVALASSAGAKHAANARAIRGDLREMVAQEASGDWTAARVALERASARLGGSGFEELRHDAEQGDRDLALAARLEAISLKRAAAVNGRFDIGENNARASQEYEAAFRDAGLGNPGQDPAEVAARVKASNVRSALLAALDDWAVCAPWPVDSPLRVWILRTARAADPEAPDWRNRVRDEKYWLDPTVLNELARTAPIDTEPLSVLIALGSRMQTAGVDSSTMLTAAQARHAGDFWANFATGAAFSQASPAQAVRYYQAALAVRPDSAIVHSNLGSALGAAGYIDEATRELYEAIRLDPSLAIAHVSLANAMWRKGNSAEGIAECRRAIQLDPAASNAYANLGVILLDTGQIDAAVEQFEKALQLNPQHANALNGIGLAFFRRGRTDDAIKEFEKALALDSRHGPAHHNLGLALNRKGQYDRALTHIRRAAELEPNNAEMRGSLAVVLRAVGRPQEAAEQCQKALQIDARNIKAHTWLGVLLAEDGRYEDAIESYRKVLQIDPNNAVAHGSLAQALLLVGQFDEALAAANSFARMMPQSDPRSAEAGPLLKRCERMAELAPRLDSFLSRSVEPASSREMLELAELCRIRRRFASAARFYSDAFAAEPALVRDVRTSSRYNAACAAALAGSASSGCVDVVNDADRAQLRDQARRWLRADLNNWEELLAGGDERDRIRLQQTIPNWQSDRDLAIIRDQRELAGLTEEERQVDEMLWKQVNDLLEKARRGK